MGLSVLELFNIGIGPGSTHAVGPMRAGNRGGGPGRHMASRSRNPRRPAEGLARHESLREPQLPPSRHPARRIENRAPCAGHLLGFVESSRTGSAGRPAPRGDGAPHVSLDKVIATMRRTRADRSTKSKETSRSGPAVNLTEC